MLIGYSRISTADQSLSLQEDALKQAGCDKCFFDITSGANAQRQGLADALAFARSGDVLVVWKLDRLGRSIQHLIETINVLSERGIGFKSLQEHMDTTTSGGKFIFHIFSAMAEFERDIIRERTRAGLTAARVRGHTGGRPHLLSDKKVQQLKKLYDQKALKTQELCSMFKISKPTLYNYLNQCTAEEKGAVV